MGPLEESVERQNSYCPNDDKTWCKYHKDEIFNTNIYDRSKCLPFVFRGELHEIFAQQSSLKCMSKWAQLNMINNMTWSKCPKRIFCSKSRFVISVCESNEIREHMEESHFWNHKHKMWSKCYCRKQFTTIKCKVKKNRKIQETQTSVTSTTKGEQER